MGEQQFTTRRWIDITCFASLLLGTWIAPRGYKFLVPLTYFFLLGGYVTWRFFHTEKPRSLTIEEEWSIEDYKTKHSAPDSDEPADENRR